MKLSNEAIKDFQKIYASKRGIDLSDKQAELMAWKLLQLSSLLLKQNSKCTNTKD